MPVAVTAPTDDRASASRPSGPPPHGLRRPPVTLEVVIPAFNEEERLPRTLAVLCEYLERQPYTAAVVVVDNGSVDRTSDIVRAWSGHGVPVFLLGCSTPGKGAAVRRGIATSSARHIGFMDADLATPIDTLDRVVPLLNLGAPVVIASRRCSGARYETVQPLGRRLAGGAFRRVARTMVTGIDDTQCGFKFFDGDVARRVFSLSLIDGFAFDLEVLGIAQWLGHRVVEVPASWQSQDGSTLGIVRHGVGIGRDLIRVRRILHTFRQSNRRQVCESVAWKPVR